LGNPPPLHLVRDFLSAKHKLQRTVLDPLQLVLSMLPVPVLPRPLLQALVLEHQTPTTRLGSRRGGLLPAVLQRFNLQHSALALLLVVLSLLAVNLRLQPQVPLICHRRQHRSHSGVRVQDLVQLLAHPSLHPPKSPPPLPLEVHYSLLVQPRHLKPAAKVGSSRNFQTGLVLSGDFLSPKIGSTNPISNPTLRPRTVVFSMLLLVMHLIPVYLRRVVTLAARRLIYHHRRHCIRKEFINSFPTSCSRFCSAQGREVFCVVRFSLSRCVILGR
jgi:hypothetical protein